MGARVPTFAIYATVYAVALLIVVGVPYLVGWM